MHRKSRWGVSKTRCASLRHDARVGLVDGAEGQRPARIGRRREGVAGEVRVAAGEENADLQIFGWLYQARFPAVSTPPIARVGTYLGAFLRFTRFTNFCTAPNSKIQQCLLDDNRF